jgi:type IV secretion system protein TrbI
VAEPDVLPGWRQERALLLGGSPTGSILLVPQGTRITGEYDKCVAFGQRRILLVWNRLIFPNGRSIVLERQPGGQTQRHAGLEDGVDYNWWVLMNAPGLSTLLAVGAEVTMDDDDRLIQAIRSGIQDTINDAGQRIVQRQLQVAPTLTISPITTIDQNPRATMLIRLPSPRYEKFCA